MLALLLTLVAWHPGVLLFQCNPGKTPLSAPSNCQQLPYKRLWTFRP